MLMDERRGCDKEKALLPWTEVLLMIIAFFQLALPRLFLFLGVVLLVSVLLMLWLR